MSSTIAVEDLRVGIYVHLEGGWLSHPFPLSSFRIASADQIATLRSLGLSRVRWVPEKSDPPPAPGAGVAAGAEAAGRGPAAPLSAAEEAALQCQQILQVQRDAAQRCERQHAEASLAWRDASDAVADQPRDAGRTTLALTRAILDKILAADDIGIRLVAGGNDRSAAHAINVGIISMLISRTLGLNEQELLDVGVGALMHDVGKTEVGERHRHLEPGFKLPELNAYRDHVAKGIGLGQRMMLPPGAQRVLAQHHEHADGGGFPLKLAGERITMGARVVALVNRYDNLCNPQARAPALTPHEAMSVLFVQGRKHFDAAVLNAFIRMMGVYPAGSLVQLTDDRFALVVGVNSSRPLKPRVLVHEPQVPRSESLLLDLEQLQDLGIRRSLPASKLPPAALAFLDPRPRVCYYFEPLQRPAAEAALP